MDFVITTYVKGIKHYVLYGGLRGEKVSANNPLNFILRPDTQEITIFDAFEKAKVVCGFLNKVAKNNLYKVEVLDNFYADMIDAAC